MALTVNDILEVRTYCRDAIIKENQINVLHFKVKDLLGHSISEQQAADWISNALAPIYQGAMANVATYVGLVLKKVLPAQTKHYVSRTGSGTGSVSASQLPSQIAGLLTYYDGNLGRAGRGHSYVGFAPATFNDANGQLTAGAKTAYGFLANYMKVDVAVQNVGGAPVNQFVMRGVIFHRGKPHTTPPVAPTATEILDAVVRDSWSQQKRRSDLHKIDDLMPAS